MEQEKNTIFDKLHEEGYDCHIIWEEKWIEMAKDYSQCYGEHSKFHLIHINQVVGAHNKSTRPILCNDELAQKTVETINNEIAKVCEESVGKVFLWIHLPHVLLGRNCYGSDEDLFDQVIGFLRTKFDDGGIFVSADHGNMNGRKGKVCYGFDVYQTAINIPLVTPRIDGLTTCDDPVKKREDELQNNVWTLVHPFIANVVRMPIEKGKYADAVDAACQAITGRIREMVEVRTGELLDGAALPQRAFSAENPVIRFDNSIIQEAYRQIFTGVLTAFGRNEDVTMEAAMRKLMTLSLLMEVIDNVTAN